MEKHLWMSSTDYHPSEDTIPAIIKLFADRAGWIYERMAEKEICSPMKPEPEDHLFEEEAIVRAPTFSFEPQAPVKNEELYKE